MSANSIIVLSKNAMKSIGEIIKPFGQFLAINFSWEDYYAFHVIRVISDAVIWEKSTYREAAYGRILYHPTLKKESILLEDIFMIEESIVDIYFSQKLKKKCELDGLKGLDFSLEPPVSSI
jgi:hypothetical protein